MEVSEASRGRCSSRAQKIHIVNYKLKRNGHFKLLDKIEELEASRSRCPSGASRAAVVSYVEVKIHL